MPVAFKIGAFILNNTAYRLRSDLFLFSTNEIGLSTLNFGPRRNSWSLLRQALHGNMPVKIGRRLKPNATKRHISSGVRGCDRAGKLSPAVSALATKYWTNREPLCRIYWVTLKAAKR